MKEIFKNSEWYYDTLWYIFLYDEINKLEELWKYEIWKLKSKKRW